MTITPEHARELLDGATPGPWHAICEKVNSGEPIPVGIVSECADTDDRGYPIGNIHVFDQGAGQAEDNVLAAAAPDLAQTIAGMTEEWGVERDRPWSAYIDGTVARGVTWIGDEARARKAFVTSPRGGNPRLVRRLVGPVEVIDE